MSVLEFLEDVTHLLKMVQVFISDGYVPREMVCGALLFTLTKYVNDVDVAEGQGDTYAVARIVTGHGKKLRLKIEHGQDNKPKITIEQE